MSTQCKGTTKSDDRCEKMTKDPSGYCHLHIGQAKPGAYREPKDDDASSVASSRAPSSAASSRAPPARKKKDVADAHFDSDDEESIADAMAALRVTRGRGDLYPIVFSYKTTCLEKQANGTGANNKVTRTKNELLDTYQVHTHMRNGQDDLADDLRDVDFDVDHNEWMAEWGVAAIQAKLVVCFMDPDYSRSKACMKELNFCRDHDIEHLVIDNYKDTSARDLAARIQSALVEQRKTGRSFFSNKK